MKLELLYFRNQKYDADHEAPLTSTAISLLFIAGVAVIIALYSTPTPLRCSMQTNQVGCQTMSSASDCNNLVQASCTTPCGGIPYTYCSSFEATYNIYDGSRLATSVSSTVSGGSTTWSSQAGPSNAATCKKFYADYATRSSNYLDNLWCSSWVGEYPMNNAQTQTSPPSWGSCTYQYPYASAQYCCASGGTRDASSESLAQCCGILKETLVCLSASNTVGVVGGYVSLWFSICNGIYVAVVFLYLRITSTLPDDADADDQHEGIELAKPSSPEEEESGVEKRNETRDLMKH